MRNGMIGSRPLIAGRYQQLDLLGQGGLGRVWHGVDTNLGRSVAMKAITAADGLPAADLEEMHSEVLREARAAARLNHPNVIRVYDIVMTDDVPWMIMEYLPSRSLSEVVAERGPMSPQQAAHCGLDVLAALTAAHGAGILHGDVKPGNVLLAQNDRAVLTGFGLATMVGDPAHTRSGALIDSPEPMAPEPAADQPVGSAADLWSLGATLYFAVEGRMPYDRPPVPATDDPPFSPASGPLWPVLEGLLRRDPEARLDATAVESMLRRIATPPPTASPRTALGRTLLLPFPAPPTAAPPARHPPASDRPLLLGDIRADDSTSDPPGKNRRRRWAAASVAAVVAVLLAMLVWLLPPGNQADLVVPNPSPSNPGPAGAAPGESEPGGSATDAPPTSGPEPTGPEAPNPNEPPTQPEPTGPNASGG